MIQKPFISKLAFSSVSSYLHLSGGGFYIWMFILQIIPTSNEQPMLIRLGGCSLSGCQRLIQFLITLSFPGAYHLCLFSIFLDDNSCSENKNHKPQKRAVRKKKNRVNREGHGDTLMVRYPRVWESASISQLWYLAGGERIKEMTDKRNWDRNAG